MPAASQERVYREKIGEVRPGALDHPRGTTAPRGCATSSATTRARARREQDPDAGDLRHPRARLRQPLLERRPADAAQYRAWIRQIAAGVRNQTRDRGGRAGRAAAVQQRPVAASARPSRRAGRACCASRTSGSAGPTPGCTSTPGTRTGRRTTTGPKFLKQSGIQYVRGFSTNVSNFRTTADEHAYAAGAAARACATSASRASTTSSTPRATAPPIRRTTRCYNPYWARVGQPPRLLFDGAFDGRLWIKHPGESDGQVNGGGPSGEWCDNLADRLLGRPESGSLLTRWRRTRSTPTPSPTPAR